MIDSVRAVRDESRDHGVAAAELAGAPGIGELRARQVEDREEQLVLLGVGPGALGVPGVSPAVDAVPRWRRAPVPPIMGLSRELPKYSPLRSRPPRRSAATG